MICIHCGNVIEENSIFCKYCGQSLGKPTHTDSPNDSNESKKDSSFHTKFLKIKITKFSVIFILSSFIITALGITNPLLCLGTHISGSIDSGNPLTYCLLLLLFFILIIKCIRNKFVTINDIIIIQCFLACLNFNFKYCEDILDFNYSRCNGYVKKERWVDLSPITELYTPFGKSVNIEDDENAAFAIAKSNISGVVHSVSVQNKEVFHDQEVYDDAIGSIKRAERINNETDLSEASRELYKIWINEMHTTYCNICNTHTIVLPEKVIVVDYTDKDGDECVGVYDIQFKNRILNPHCSKPCPQLLNDV